MIVSSSRPISAVAKAKTRYTPNCHPLSNWDNQQTNKQTAKKICRQITRVRAFFSFVAFALAGDPKITKSTNRKIKHSQTGSSSSCLRGGKFKSEDGGERKKNQSWKWELKCNGNSITWQTHCVRQSNLNVSPWKYVVFSTVQLPVNKRKNGE